MDADLWMRKAQESISQEVEVNQKFELRSLFKAVEWESLSKGERIQFGKDFANAVSEELFPGIERIQRADNNHARYIKRR